MIEEIVEIGDILIGDASGNDAYLSVLTEDIEVPTGDEKRYVAKIDFSTNEKKINIDCAEEIDDETAKNMFMLVRQKVQIRHNGLLLRHLLHIF